ncbi:MAG: hypothetical protein ACKPAC_07985 [Alphaproteobacteria bacterium]
MTEAQVLTLIEVVVGAFQEAIWPGRKLVRYPSDSRFQQPPSGRAF